MLRSVYDRPDAPAVQAQFDRLLDYVQNILPEVFKHLATQHYTTSRGSTAKSPPRRIVNHPFGATINLCSQVRDGSGSTLHWTFRRG